MRLRVRSKRTRYTFDGQTGLVVLAGTPGTVVGMFINKPDNSATLEIAWDAAATQEKGNDPRDDFQASVSWEETEVNPSDVEFIETENTKPRTRRRRE